MKILVISQYFRPDITAAAFRIADTTDLLAERGHEVAVICAVPHKASVGEVSQGGDYHVERVAIAPIAGGMTGYLKHYLSFVANAIWRGRSVVRSVRPDVVWMSSPPLFVSLAGVVLAWLARAPLVVDIRDIWPESAVAARQLSNGGRAFRIGKWLEHWTYRRADALTCVSSPMAAYLAAASGKQVSVVYNGVRRSLATVLPPHPSDKPRRRIVYAGNLGRAQGLEMLVAAFGTVADAKEAEGWELEFIGTGALEADLRALAAGSPHKDRIVFTPPMSKEDVMRYMSDVALLFLNLDADPVFEKTIPSKVFDYMLIGRPILAGIGGEGAAILDRSGGNITFAPSDPGAMARAIFRGISDWDELAGRAAANREIALADYSREQAVTTLEAVLRSSVERRTK